MKFNSIEEAIKTHRDYHGFAKGRKLMFDKVSQDYHVNKARINYIISHINEHDKVLDLGSSAGEFMRFMERERNCVCTGIEVNKSCIDAGRAYGTNIIEGAVENIPFDDETFDVCVASEILEHLYDPVLCIKESYRVLKTGGVFTGSVPHHESPTIKEKPARIYRFHARDYDKDLLLSHLSSCFDSIEINEVVLNTVDGKKGAFWYVFSANK